MTFPRLSLARLVACTLTSATLAPLAVQAQTADPCERLASAGWLGALQFRDRELCQLRTQLATPNAPTAQSGSLPAATQAMEKALVIVVQRRDAQEPVSRPSDAHAIAEAGDTFRADQLLNIRSGPGVDHGMVARVQQDDLVTLTGVRHGEWWQVKHTHRAVTTTGWVFSLWLRRFSER